MRSSVRGLTVLSLAASLGLAACAGGGQPGYGGLGTPGIGTAAGAAGGAAIGRAIAGGNNNMAAILGGAALGGLAGNVFGDRPTDARRRQEAEIAKDSEQQRRLDYERQSTLQQEEVRKQIEDQRLFEEWKAQRSGGRITPSASPAPMAYDSGADVLTAQRLLTALGYYRGPMDGSMGPSTRSAVMQFEAARGLPQTGVITPSLLSQMRATL